MTRTDVNNLRTRIAEVVAGNKAYDVPAICARLGLAPGTEDEAMRSKLRYVNSRLNSVPTARLVKIAQELLEQDGDFWLAEHVAKVAEQGTPPVSVLTRRRIFDAFEGEPLCTEYDQLDFIEQIWPVAAMPSAFADTDVWGHRSLKDDIVQHTIRNDDWTNRELLERLGLLDASKALLFRFLEAAVHPTAIDENGQKDRVERINRHLQHDGYRLSRTGRISGCPVYTVNAAAIGSPADATISNTLAKFEPEQVHARWTAALDRRSDDPAGAITLARTLLEDVCRWLLDDLDIPAADQDDLPALYRKLSKGLKLAPDDHSEQVFKQILGNCQSIVESLGALRNKLGDAHGGGTEAGASGGTTRGARGQPRRLDGDLPGRNLGHEAEDTDRNGSRRLIRPRKDQLDQLCRHAIGSTPGSRRSGQIRNVSGNADASCARHLHRIMPMHEPGRCS